MHIKHKTTGPFAYKAQHNEDRLGCVRRVLSMANDAKQLKQLEDRTLEPRKHFAQHSHVTAQQNCV